MAVIFQKGEYVKISDRKLREFLSWGGNNNLCPEYVVNTMKSSRKMQLS